MPGQSNRPEGSSSALSAGGWRVPRACSCRADLVLPRMPTLWLAGCESAGCCRGLLRPKSPVGKDSGGWPDALVIGRYGVDAFRPSDIPVGRVALPAIPLSRFLADADSVGIGSVSVPAGGFGLRNPVFIGALGQCGCTRSSAVFAAAPCISALGALPGGLAWAGSERPREQASVFVRPSRTNRKPNLLCGVSGSTVQPVEAVLCPDVGSTLCGECQGKPTH